MPFIPKRPPSLVHLSDAAAARVLSRNFGDVAKAAKDLGVHRSDLRHLTWHNPRILDASHERMELFVDHMWGEAVRGLYSKRASDRMRAADRIFAHPRAIGNPFAAGFAPAPRARGPRGSNVFVEAERARLVIEGEVAAEQSAERAAEQSAEREREWALEQERVEVMVERRPSAPPVAPAMNLWPSGIRRPTRGRRW